MRKQKTPLRNKVPMHVDYIILRSREGVMEKPLFYNEGDFPFYVEGMGLAKDQDEIIKLIEIHDYDWEIYTDQDLFAFVPKKPTFHETQVHLVRDELAKAFEDYKLEWSWVEEQRTTVDIEEFKPNEVFYINLTFEDGFQLEIKYDKKICHIFDGGNIPAEYILIANQVLKNYHNTLGGPR